MKLQALAWAVDYVDTDGNNVSVRRGPDNLGHVVRVWFHGQSWWWSFCGEYNKPHAAASESAARTAADKAASAAKWRLGSLTELTRRKINLDKFGKPVVASKT